MLLDRRAARRHAETAATDYDKYAVLQAEVRGQLLERLALTTLDPAVIVDAGCGTGHASRALRRRYPRSRVIAVDSSPGMLRAARAQAGWFRPFERVCADAEQLPFADASVDLVFSNLLVHWCDPRLLLAELRRVLTPGGLLSFSSLGPDTLRELRTAWGSADSGAHVHFFPDMHDIGDELVRAGFSAPVLDVERYTLQYADLAALLADLRGAGAANALVDRPKGLTGKGKLERLRHSYEALRKLGRLPASVEVVYGQAWAPRLRGRAAQEPSATTGISLAALRAKLPRNRRE